MLRCVRYHSPSKTVVEFCCSRVVFGNTKIYIPSLHRLFDNHFIEEKFLRYKHSKNRHQESKILRDVCGKCEGYGFYDWVTKLTDGDDSPIYNIGGGIKIPIVIKNENPITCLLTYNTGEYIVFYYQTKFTPSPISYRCEKCHGTGLNIYHRDIGAITLEDIQEDFVEEAIRQTQDIIYDIPKGGKQLCLKKLKSKVLNFIQNHLT